MKIQNLLDRFTFNDKDDSDELGMLISNNIDRCCNEYGGLISVDAFEGLANDILSWHEKKKSTEQKLVWINTTESLPQKIPGSGYEHIDCWIYIDGQVLERPWNCEHNCWDDTSYDDFEFDATQPSHWMIKPDITPGNPT